jgi:hypothetical protein
MKPTAKTLALLAVLLVALVLVLDLWQSGPPNPYSAPPALAIGSGAAPSGAHCSAGAGR